MPAIPSGADVLANDLLVSLTAGKNFDIPEINLDEYELPEETGPLYEPVNKLTNEDLTTREVGGSGTFDALMASVSNHLKDEYRAQRITGQEYTKAYIALVAAALSTATQYLLGKDQAYWQALLVQQQARLAQIEAAKAKIEFQTAKMELIRIYYDALTAEVNYGLTKMKIATEDATYNNLTIQAAGLTLDNAAKTFTNAQMLPIQRDILDVQRTGIGLDNTGKDFTNTYLLPKQRDVLQEQIEVQRAQTLDSRTDGQLVTGSVGKQKDLYTQQITSYKRDAETKAAKLYTDGWITQKTIDEGLLAPDEFTNAGVNGMLAALRNNLGM